MSAGNKVENKTYELVAPDGGWGYMICLSFIINISVSCSFLGCFGLIYDDFLKEIGMNSTAVTLLSGVNASCVALTGFFTSSLIKLTSVRKLAFISAVILDTGLVGMIFVKSTVTFFICQGILPGISMGLTYNLCCSIMNDYFVKRRMFAFSLVQFFVAVFAMLAPFLVNWSLGTYGYRGTLILIAGISLTNVIGVALMQPVKYHMKRVEVVVTTEMKPLLIEKKSSEILIKLTEENAEKGGSTDIINEMALDSEKPSKLMKFVTAFIDPPFFKKFVLTCACLGTAICNFSEATFQIILPQALYSSDWTPDNVTLAVSLYGFGDLFMRTVMIFISNWMLKIGSEQLYIIGLALACFSKFGMIWSENIIPIYIYITLQGVARCFVVVLTTVVISDAVPQEKFTQAIGIFMMISGSTVLVLGPAIGAIRDLTNSYSSAFYLLTSCYAIMILFWSIELCYKKNKDKRIAQKENAAKLNQSNKGT